MNEETYVYDGVEVRKTGRTASQTLRSNRLDVLIEITPVDSIVGSWKKWVKNDQMHKVDKNAST